MSTLTPTTVTSTSGISFDLAKHMLYTGAGDSLTSTTYGATKAALKKILTLRPNQTIRASFYSYGSKATVNAGKSSNGSISFGCMNFSPSNVNKLRTWVGLPVLAAKSKKSIKTKKTSKR